MNTFAWYDIETAETFQLELEEKNFNDAEKSEAFLDWQSKVPGRIIVREYLAKEIMLNDH